MVAAVFETMPGDFNVSRREPASCREDRNRCSAAESAQVNNAYFAFLIFYKQTKLHFRRAAPDVEEFV